MTVHTVALILWDDEQEATTLMFNNELSLSDEEMGYVVEDTVIAMADVVKQTLDGIQRGRV